ncbi:MAG TPA: hypothetical protein VGM68_08360 [Rhizomicrobium sp.]|jgi:hypothetical protein
MKIPDPKDMIFRAVEIVDVIADKRVVPPVFRPAARILGKLHLPK